MKLVKTLLTPPVCAISFVCAFALSVRAADLYVSTNGLHSIDGVVWGRYMTDDGVMHDAYTNLQQAVNAAAKNDTVWVEDGFVCDDSQGYKVVSAKDGVYNNLRLDITKAITVRSRSGEWETGAVIRGRFHGDVAGGASTGGDYAIRGVSLASGAQLIGFTVEHCSMDGGIYGTGASVQGGVLRKCFINDGRSGYFAGANGSTLYDCVVSNCCGSTYSSMLCGSAYGTTFYGTGGGSGGGLYLTSGSHVISNCVIRSGKSTTNGQVETLVSSGAGPLVIDCLFTGNSGDIIGCQYNGNSRIRIENCTFTGNGGTIFSSMYSLTSNPPRTNNCVYVKNCFVTNNVLDNNSRLVYASGEIVNTLFANNVQNGNSAVDLFATPTENTRMKLLNCTVVCNSNKNGRVGATARLAAVNTIFHGNNGKPGLSDAFAEAQNSCLDASATVETGTDNTTDDPLLVDVARGIYTPSELSPCYAGGSLTAYELPATDLAGRPRLTDGHVAIGAFEYDPANVDVKINLSLPMFLHAPAVTQFDVMAAGFGFEPDFYWDFDGDGKIDLLTHVNTLVKAFEPGDWAVTLYATNPATGFGAACSCAPFTVVPKPIHYVREGNPGAEAPYTNLATAAATIKDALAIAIPNAEVIVEPGTYAIDEELKVTNDYLVVRGSTGNPADVIVHAPGTSPNRCLRIDAGPHAIVHSMTFENGNRSTTFDFGGGVFMGKGDPTATGSFTPAVGAGGILSNAVVRNCKATAKFTSASGIYAYGANAFVTHTVVSNCTCEGAYVDGGNVGGVALELRGGARAENCLITGNRSTDTYSYASTGNHVYTYYHDGLFKGAVFVGGGSSIRHSTIVGNRGAFCGGVIVNGTGRFEKCVIADNTVFCPDIVALGERYRVWAAFSDAVQLYLTSRTLEANKKAFDDMIAAEQKNAANVAAQNTTNAVDVAETGLGAGTIVATPEQLFRNAAKRDWRLRPSSPARDIVEPADAGAMAATDLLGNPRLSNGLYDLGCFEAVFRGFGIFVR